MKPAMTPQQARLSDSGRSGLAIYRELVVGNSSWARLLHYELLMLGFSGLPGLLGFGARTLLYPALFQRCGKRPAFGKGMVIRRPAQISLGSKVMCDDYSVLDARGDSGIISLGDHVSLGRFSSIVARGGQIFLGNGVNIGSYCRIGSQSKVEIGDSVLFGAYTYVGPGNHMPGDENTPLIAQEMESKGGVKIGAHAWLGTHVTILDGVTIGEGAIVGAHSLVRDNVPAGMIAVGSPARVLRSVA